MFSILFSHVGMRKLIKRIIWLQHFLGRWSKELLLILVDTPVPPSYICITVLTDFRSWRKENLEQKGLSPSSPAQIWLEFFMKLYSTLMLISGNLRWKRKISNMKIWFILEKSVFDVFFFLVFKYVLQIIWCRGVVVISTAQLHSTKLEIRFCVGSNPARGVSEIRDAEDLWQWSRLKIRLNVFRWSTMPQKQFIIIIIITIIISNSPIVCRRFQPPLPPRFYIQSPYIPFPNPPLLARLFRQYRPIEIPDKHKNKLMWQSYFFIFRRLKSHICMVFYINSTLVSNTWMIFNQK